MNETEQQTGSNASSSEITVFRRNPAGYISNAVLYSFAALVLVFLFKFPTAITAIVLVWVFLLWITFFRMPKITIDSLGTLRLLHRLRLRTVEVNLNELARCDITLSGIGSAHHVCLLTNTSGMRVKFGLDNYSGYLHFKTLVNRIYLGVKTSGAQTNDPADRLFRQVITSDAAAK